MKAELPIRTQDRHGSGEFGAPRKGRTHKGVDYVAPSGSQILSPVAGDAHHIKGVGNFSGVAMKAPDQYTMPLCRSCHTAMHNNHDHWERQWEFVTRTLGKAISDGVFIHEIPRAHRG